MATAEEYFNAHKPSSDMSASAATLKVYWHVISVDSTLEGGNIPDKQITDSIKVLNGDFRNSGLSFSMSLADINRVTNPDWFNNADPGSAQETAMKEALHQGGPSDLNIYSVGSIVANGDELLGYATFPSQYVTKPKNDGVVFLYSSVPGGSAAPYNLGKTLTHEVGHWVGLYHTFEDHRGGRGSGCEGLGDEVLDTPPEASPASGCPTGRDTCPGGGLDPIHNFMDYTDDACMNQFTPGQTLRLKQQLAVFRGISPT
ncbi:unnamed protein product [Rhizoctonia solani]|uniref:Peptidase M43 pregnancy-associated plasma-A domain-containing protein n=1 Tax=Rhizoctonia solani TaxID=456999 RepID=A0A8H3B8C8_9AGAM|nr:unnamed protein product [Rhizoctonia solani]